VCGNVSESVDGGWKAHQSSYKGPKVHSMAVIRLECVDWQFEILIYVFFVVAVRRPLQG